MAKAAIDKSFYRRLVFLALPIIGQDLLNALVNILDTFMIGSLGGTAITAVGLSNQLFFIYILIVSGVASGAGILMGQYHGAGDVKSIRKTLGIAIIMSACLAIFFAVFAMTRPELILSIYSRDLAVIAEGVKYLRIVGPAYLIGAFTIPISTALRCMGHPRLPMITTIIALVTNVALNYTFIFILGWGVEGAAIATLTARTCELVAQQILIRKWKMPLLGKLRDFLAADKAFFKKYIVLALPVILNEGIWAIGTSMYNAAYKYCGTDAQTALQITNTIQNLFWVAGMGTGAAAGIILANVLGTGKRELAILYARRIQRIIAILGILIGLLFLALAPFIAQFFNVNDTVLLYSQQVAYVIAGMMVIKVLNFTNIVGVLRSGGDTMFCMIIDAASVWAVGVPLAFLGAYALGLPIYWVVLMVHAEEIVKLAITLPRVLTNKWAKTLV